MRIVEINEDVCLLDIAMTHSILCVKEYFTNLTLHKANVHTILGHVKIIEGSGHATIMLPNGITLHLEDALLCSRSNRILLSFQDIRRNGYHLETLNVNKNDFLCITSYKNDIKTVHEKLEANNSRLYCVQIRAIESYTTMSWRLVKLVEFGLWHDRLGLGAIMMRRIIVNTRGSPLKNTKVLLFKDYSCETCSQGKLITKPSFNKVDLESSAFLQKIQGRHFWSNTPIKWSI